MHNLIPTQKRILKLLPATPDQLAQALYGRATASERNLIYVHIALLRRRLNGTAHIVSNSLSPSQRSPNAEENACPERRPEAPPELDEATSRACRGGPVEGLSRRDGLEADSYTCLPGHRQASRIIYELQTEGA